jgi:hypothetical protein
VATAILRGRRLTLAGSLMSDWSQLPSGAVSSCTFRGTDVPPIAAQPVFCPEYNGLDRREAAVERAGDLGVTHPLVVAEHKWNLIVIRFVVELPFSKGEDGARKEQPEESS